MMIKKISYAVMLCTMLLIQACSKSEDKADSSPAPKTKGKNFVNFETGQVRPLAKSPDGSKLFALNTPNSTLEIYTISDKGLTHYATVPVGLEPVAVAALNNNEVWVVNHLSDSVSVVDVSTNPPKVSNTLLVGDEPRDIVFAGSTKKFAFITTAHRGQNGVNGTPVNAQLTTPGIGRADVWVFDSAAVGSTIGGSPATVLTLFGDTPRALAVSPDGKMVYAAVFFSGNRTTTLGQDVSLNKHAPLQNTAGATQPSTGLIVQYNGTNWVDETGSSMVPGTTTLYNSKVPFSLPDYDVFAINANLDIPVVTDQRWSGVGTTLFNMISNPVGGKLYVSNTNALNLTRFEGARSTTSTASTVRGHFVESRITVINGNTVTPIHLNNHIDYAKLNGTQQEREAAMSQPQDMAISSDGNTLYVTGFGSQKVAFYDTATLEANALTPSPANQIGLSAGGPSGVILDEVNKRLYVLTRFDNGISIINTATKSEISHLTMYNPEPDRVIAGRQFLYNATATSSHGDSSCGLCHVFGDFDGLAWDLGDPEGVVASNTNNFVAPFLKPNSPVFHPMKGPMTTQSFRGLKGNGPMHWRGDRTGVSKLAGESLELGAFKDFNVAFPGLVGREKQLSNSEMQAFAEFALGITYPPNPIRALDNSLSSAAAEGKRIYLTELTTGGGSIRCNDCHVLEPINGHFGTAGLSTLEGPDISQEFKVPHLRNAYQKIGKFGNSGQFSTDKNSYGEQVRGFGFMHDGGMDTLDKFLQGNVFKFDTDAQKNTTKRGQVVDFVLAMDSDLAPIVGQQITLSASSPTEVSTRINLLRARSMVTTPRPECDLIVKGVIDNEARGFLMLGNGNYQSDRKAIIVTDNELRNFAKSNNQMLTFTCVPPGSGIWMGIDRDEDGRYDRDELDAVNKAKALIVTSKHL